MADRSDRLGSDGADTRALAPVDAAAEEAERAWLAAEDARAREAVTWLSSRPQAKRVAPLIEAMPADLAKYQARICHSLGSRSISFCDRIIHQLLSTPGGSTQDERESRANEGLQFIAAYGPENEIETTVLLQAWMTHISAITAHRRLSDAENVPQLEAHGSIAVKLSRLYIQQIEALPRMKPAKQVIEVQHVHVYPGGQAVVGAINPPRGEEKSLVQPHAQLADAREPALWSEDPEREALPRAGDEIEVTLPHARRKQSGSAEG